MQFHSWLTDRKIRAINVSIDMPLGDYAALARAIVQKNELQRRKASSVGKVYELLRRDILEGCVMPPIILAVNEAASASINSEIVARMDQREPTAQLRTKVEECIKRAVQDHSLIILDGLQRTFAIQECLDSIEDPARRSEVEHQPIRLEVYVGLSKMGILYRMMTLNTGQTPMSVRHQIEILHHDYIDSNALPDGISVLREVEEKRTRGLGKYKYSDVVDMFHAYATGIPQSFDRQALVTKLQELDFVESYRPGSDDMLQLLQTYNTFVTRVTAASNNWEFTEPEEEESEPEIDRPFGLSVPSIFAKVQPMTGYGAECNRMRKMRWIQGINDLLPLIGQCKFSSPPDESIRQLLIILDEIAQTAKKIGDAQRAYFQVCFRSLFNRDSDSYLDLSKCWVAAQALYKTMY